MDRAEPYATIRRHPLVDHDLADLESLGMVDADVRSLLAAAVRARWNILFAGGQGNGKTTLMRAAAHAAHPDERTVTIEAIPELHLDRLPHRHRHVVSLWERPANMQGEGAVTAADLAWHAKHLSPDQPSPANSPIACPSQQPGDRRSAATEPTDRHRPPPPPTTGLAAEAALRWRPGAPRCATRRGRPGASRAC